MGFFCIFLHLGVSFWICVVIFFSFLCHVFVILLSFWERENGKNLKTWLPWQTFCYLVAAPNTRNNCRNSWEASRPWRRIGQGSLPWGIRFWACLDEELSPGSGCRAGSKTGWGGRGRGEMAPGGGGSGPRSGADLETPKTQFYQHASHFFWHFFAFSLHFLHFFCISQTRLGVIFFAFVCTPQTGIHFLAFSCSSQTGVIFCIFLAFPRPALPPSPLAWSGWENDKKMNNARK